MRNEDPQEGIHVRVWNINLKFFLLLIRRGSGGRPCSLEAALSDCTELASVAAAEVNQVLGSCNNLGTSGCHMWPVDHSRQMFFLFLYACLGADRQTDRQTDRDTFNIIREQSEALDPLSDALDLLSDALDPLSDALDPLSDALDPLSEALGPLSDALDPLSEALDLLSDALDPLSDAPDP